ncbi:RIP metalloprotease RseP [Clostridium gasigenes]|nr:RIP metalloprotease RseP [Clostridium gasigenes]NKF06042.1 RIP metalloprotease RseP [Clostridium gasigenes]
MYVYIVFAMLAFSLLIIVHELGHFVMAKVNGIKVEEFAIGMGPKMFSAQGKETKYSIGILPIGGYVKMLGEEEEVEDNKSFSSKSPLRRISVILAGSIMNFLLALVLFTIILSKNGYSLPKVGEVQDNTPAYEAGLQTGDEFLNINGDKVFSADDILMGVMISKGEPVDIVYKRSGEIKEVTITPKIDEKNKYLIGISFVKIQNPTFYQGFKQSFKQTETLIVQTFKGLKMLVTGKANLKTDVGGPVTIIRLSGEAAKGGILNLMYFTAFISVNLAVFNLLPFPALDGGWTVILLIELITRRKVPDKIVATVNYIGMILLFGFMILITVKDVLFPIKF